MEILRFAQKHHIEVIPELEMPGHARAAVKAMEARFRALNQAGRPEEAKRYLLSDPADTSTYRSVQGYRDNYRIPTPRLSRQGHTVSVDQQLPGFTLRYTTDDSEPTLQSPPWRGPVTGPGVIKVAAFNTRGRRGKSARIVVMD